MLSIGIDLDIEIDLFGSTRIAGQRGGEVRMTMITFSKSYCSNDDVILSNNDVNIRAPSYSFAQLYHQCVSMWPLPF